MLQKMHKSEKFLAKIAFRASKNFERQQKKKRLKNVTNAHYKTILQEQLSLLRKEGIP